METNDRIQLLRKIILDEKGPKTEVAKILSLIWEDETVDSYLKSHQITVDDMDEIESLICHGIYYFLVDDERADGTNFIKWDRDTPDFFRVNLMKVHVNDDWRYGKLLDMAMGFLDCPNGDYFLIDMQADCYTSDLLHWLGLNYERHGYVQEAEVESKIMSSGGTLFDLLQLAQSIEIQEMGQEFVQTIKEMADLIVYPELTPNEQGEFVEADCSLKFY